MYRDTSVNYLIMINMLKNKINFGKDQYSLKIDFAWKDILTDEKFISNSIHFEYFSIMFNLGIVYFEMGKANYFSEEDLKLKDGVKYFQTAAWIFDRIKEEYQLYVQALNIQPDLQMNFMSFVSIIIIFCFSLSLLLQNPASYESIFYTIKIFPEKNFLINYK